MTFNQQFNFSWESQTNVHSLSIVTISNLFIEEDNEIWKIEIWDISNYLISFLISYFFFKKSKISTIS